MTVGISSSNPWWSTPTPPTREDVLGDLKINMALLEDYLNQAQVYASRVRALVVRLEKM